MNPAEQATNCLSAPPFLAPLPALCQRYTAHQPRKRQTSEPIKPAAIHKRAKTQRNDGVEEESLKTNETRATASISPYSGKDSKKDSNRDSSSILRHPLSCTMTSTFVHDVSTFAHHDIHMYRAMAHPLSRTMG
jgi:hypothetical protein